MNVLVTGGAGFIGSHLVEELSYERNSVTVLDNLRIGKKENLSSVLDKIDFVEGDIRDYNLLEQVIKNVDSIYHQASLASVPESFVNTKEYYDVNVTGTENIFKLAKKYKCKVVYASSSSVYGNPVKIPIREDHPKNPINPYAQTKLEDETLAQRYATQGTEIIGLRYFNVFGERQSKEYAGVLKKFLENVYSNKPPIINGDGLQTRDFVFVGDVVKANVMAMKSNIKNEFFNIGSNSSISILELANLVIKESGLSLNPIHVSPLKGDVEKSEADNSLAKRLLRWEPKTLLREWLKIAIPSRLV